MPLVNMVNMLNKAKEGKYAVGQFNINNLEWTKTILETAQSNNSPVILGVSEGAGKYMGGFDVVVGMVKGLVKDLGITVDVAIHLDHGSSFESCKKAIDAGFTSVMIDGSHHPIDENIKMTKEVVDYAHARGVSVEAEVGTVGGNEDGVIGGIKYADLNECVRLVKEADVDALAPALGSVHGPYQGEPVLGFVEMEAIGKATDKPLVLHGGTGIPDDKIRRAIACGTCKINVNTECQLAFNKLLREFVADEKNAKVYDPRKILGPASKGIAAAVNEKINVFGTANKN
ncbi:MAG: class II fructose-1,6-bisphosphate aldolase [Bacilli bacterium]|nr:class II fructose-1,6-bisphosphate aldolase [Mollicutes bacterium]MDY3899276.1 class II fructose-1,6-bisphosphate aldolase [Bacilli bacterium]